MPGESVEDRQLGCLVGLAVGDALGAPVEFKSPGSFDLVTGYRDGGPHNLKAGEWTDDTSMALALADSITQAGWDLTDQAERYLRWWQDGEYSVNGKCFDIGMTTRAALDKFRHSHDVSTCGINLKGFDGNGSIMRLAPVAIYCSTMFPDTVERRGHFGGESSIVTHASPKCIDACRYMNLILCGLIHAGYTKTEILSRTWDRLTNLNYIWNLDSEIILVARSIGMPLVPEPSGYVVKTLEAALWAFRDADTFEDAVLKAVNLGGDADTVGAVCGQLAGSYWGLSGIPSHLIDGLADYDRIKTSALGIIDRN